MSGLRRGGWTTHELLRLRELFPRAGAERVAKLLGRSVDAVRRQAQKLYEDERRSGPWDDSDDDRLREAFGVHDLDTLALLVGREKRLVVERIAAFRTGLRAGSWTDAEVARLKRLYGTRDAADLVVCLSRCPVDVEVQALLMCLGKDKREAAERVRMPRWSAAEIARLRELYADHDNLEIARALGRSVASVANKAYQLGLGKSPSALRAMGRRNVQKRRATTAN